MNITYSLSEKTLPVSIEWRWTGFTPGSLLLQDDMKQTLRYLAAIPRHGVRYVRIHNLLELVTAKGLGSDTPLYDWSKLDEGLDALVENRLIPFFELMGNPSRYFNDFQDRGQAEAWKRLVRDLALHLQDRYGREEIEQWYFETWNEPDCGWWHQSVENFLVYYDACSEGLKEANPALVFGGPGTARTLSKEITTLLAHVDGGTNPFTGRQDVRMDFLSVHEKGAWFSPEDLPVSPERMVARTRELRDYLAEHHPKLLALPVMNNECDPQVGWKDPHSWRATAFYAAIMAKGLFHHFDTLVDEDGVDFTIFGNDNGFIGGWAQRTQLTRFAVPHRETDFFELIKKPALSLMTALSFAGQERVKGRIEGGDSVTGLCTLLPEQQGVALFLSVADNRARTGGQRSGTLRLEDLPQGAYTLVQYRIDEDHGNPYRVWEEVLPPMEASNWVPGETELRAMRAQQELTRFGDISEIELHADGAWETEWDIPLPGVHVFLLLRKEAFAPPEAVTGLRAEAYHGVHDATRILVSWNPPEARSVVDHRVEWRATEDDAWQTADHPPLLDGSWVHILPAGSPVPQYRITPVDAWNREGPARVFTPNGN
ncbi:MAG: hypothetical protein JJU05_03315 [Verrucomicrobia bacterium]|nr:hypothetical protein [Verrucomicrobiota bacterium]MCH8527822.1 hypothetical protein [Kiritimatiellia bacterium]